MHQLGPADPASTPSLRAQARSGARTLGRIVGSLTVSWPRPPAVSQSKPSCRSAHARAPARRAARAPARRAPRPCALCRACRSPPWPYRSAQAVVSWRVLCTHLAVSWPRSQYSPAFNPPSSHNTPWCIAIQSLLPAFLSHCIAIQFPLGQPPFQPHRSRYNSSITTHFFFSQYKLGSNPFQFFFSAFIYLFFVFHYIFFSFVPSYWKTPKIIYTPFFFSRIHK